MKLYTEKQVLIKKYVLEKIKCDICKLLKLNPKNAKKIERDLLKFYVILDGVKYHLFSRAIIITSEGQYDYFVINPSVT